jgi:DNA-binding transcriptional LysR family regulator
VDLGDLRIFRSVVQEGGITRAAERLNRVQSNVTTRVRQLEQDLGVELFIREGKRMHLSPTGKLLLDYADKLLDLADEARDAMHDGEPRGPFRLGAIETTAAMRLPGPLSEFHRRYPEVKLELQTHTIAELAAGVQSGVFDAALVAEPVSDEFDKQPVYDEELVLVAQAGHPAIRTPRDLKNRTVLAFHAGCPYRLRMQQWFARFGALPEAIIEMTSWHAMVGCVAARMGVAVLPRIVLSSFPKQNYLSVHPLPEGLNHAPTVLITRKGARSPKVTALLEVLKEDAGAGPAKPARKRR